MQTVLRFTLAVALLALTSGAGPVHAWIKSAPRRGSKWLPPSNGSRMPLRPLTRSLCRGRHRRRSSKRPVMVVPREAGQR